MDECPTDHEVAAAAAAELAERLELIAGLARQAGRPGVKARRASFDAHVAAALELRDELVAFLSNVELA